MWLLSQFICISEKESFWGGVDVCPPMCMHTQHMAHEPPPTKSSFSFSARQTHRGAQKSLLLDSKRASSNLPLHQSMIFPPGKGHLERRYESDSTLELNQKAKQLIYYAVTSSTTLAAPTGISWCHECRWSKSIAVIGEYIRNISVVV